VHAARATLASVGVNAKTSVDSAIFGNVAQTSSDAAYLARHVALRSDLAVHTPALTVNRLCGSGMQAVINGYQDIVLGDAEVVLTGGTESMSQAPYAVRNVRFGTQLGVNPPFEDTLWSALTDSYAKVPMGITAENLAEQYKLSRQEVDAYAVRSQQRWAAAEKAGIFKREIAPIEVKTKKGPVTLGSDEGPRPETTVEGLAKLKPVFKKDGVVHAGSASGVTDGAAAVLIASADALRKHGWTPLAEIVAYHYAGVEPTVMGIGPVPAIRGALKKAKLTLDDMDLIEVRTPPLAHAAPLPMPPPP
jgi:acetyl-CoA acyltransferase 2